MKRDIPFIPNEPDNRHCAQASSMMIAKYFDPAFDISMDEWSKITAFDKTTWEGAALLWFKNNGYTVKHITLFDYDDFIANGGDYLRRAFGDEVANWQIENSNIPAEMERSRQLLKSDIIEAREPTAKDIKGYLDHGYLLRVLVNSLKLENKPGYIGHSVVIYDYDKAGVFLQNPGLPPQPHQKVDWQTFEAAWAYPTATNKELDAIKK